MPDADQSGSALRTFALAVYGEDGVPGACLALQDGLGVDVNVVLFAAYVGAVRGERITAADLAAARVRIGAWHDDVVIPLRDVRRRLKGYPVPTPGEAAAADLRRGLQRLEIDAELVELDALGILADADHTEPRATAAGPPTERAAEAILVVVDARGGVDGELRDAVERIAAAAAGQAQRLC